MFQPFEMTKGTRCCTPARGEALVSTPHFKIRSKGWRRAAVINTWLISILFVTLNILLAIAYAYSEEDGKVTVLYAAPCGTEKTDTANTMFHLLVNIFSTAILASSNFFMQVLNSPTRKELDKAHSNGSWLDIGVSSARNALRASWIKAICWTSFFLSSIPIHLLFNSAIFSIDYRGSSYNLTIAAEPFLHGSPGYWPGAGETSEVWGEHPNQYCFEPIYPPTDSMEVVFENDIPEKKRIVAETRIQWAQWKRIDVDTCKTLYFNGTGVHTYRDVVFVLDRPNGWLRSQIWDLSQNSSEFWDRCVPENEPNFLFLSSLCGMGVDQLNYTARLEFTNSCTGHFDLQHNSTTGLWTLQFPNILSWWCNEFCEEPQRCILDLDDAKCTRKPPRYGDFILNYCVVEPNDATCRIGLSIPLLLVVVLFVLVKTLLCVWVLRLQHTTPLVTLGDVIESNICYPSVVTKGLCLPEKLNSRRKCHSKPGATVPLPKAWNIQPKRLFNAVPISVWVFSYALFTSGIIVIIYFLHLNQLSAGGL